LKNPTAERSADGTEDPMIIMFTTSMMANATLKMIKVAPAIFKTPPTKSFIIYIFISNEYAHIIKH
jgi:hypothetical protein